MVRGRYDAWRFRNMGKPTRRHRVMIGIGAGLVAVGVPTLALAVPMTLSADAPYTRAFALLQLGASLTGAGVGLWTYGSTYGKRTGTARFVLLPQLAPDRVGLSLASRF
jgi:hypothetical protein